MFLSTFCQDSWWNVAVENQALHRVHRIGQKYPVLVTRFIIQKTVEKKMLKIQARKQSLANFALATSDQDQKQLRLDDLRNLFSNDDMELDGSSSSTSNENNKFETNSSEKLTVEDF